MATKMVAVKDLTPGLVLSDAVISVSGKVLLGKDVELTQRHISLLTIWDVKSVFIDIKEDEQVPAGGEEPVVTVQPDGKEEPAVNKAVAQEYVKFVREFDSVVTSVAQTFEIIQKQNIIPLSHLKDTAGQIHSSIQSNRLAGLNHLLISDYKLADFISRHSVMVAYLAGNIARKLKWSEEDIRGVALAGLLHDVGSLAGGKKNDPRAHIAEAAALLKKLNGVPSEVILGVVQHRECIDGSGFPTAAKGFKIHPYAKIIAIADTFHVQAYTGEYANPFPVLDMLAYDMLGKLDTAICQAFIGQVKDSLLNNRVILLDGREAEVIFFHPNGSYLPVVRTADGQIIDLARRGGAAISRIVAPN